MARTVGRRDVLRAGLLAAGSVALGSGFWRALAGHVAPVPGPSPYGPLGVEDANGLRIPDGFEVRLVARSATPVAGTSYLWPFRPDGGATFATDDGGWIYVANSEVGSRGGGVSSLRFDADGRIVDAYRILGRTNTNCAGGATPWGTWLSCEEEDMGMVWECDPLNRFPGIVRPAMGMFTHEAAVVDPMTRFVYMTEDRSDGCFYRFRPTTSVTLPTDVLPVPVLEDGVLEVAKVTGDIVEWLPVPTPYVVSLEGTAITTPTRYQVPGATPFKRGEGAWFDASARAVYFCTTSDNTIWTYSVDEQRIEKLYDGERTDQNPLRGADNIVVAPWGDILVCEDPPSAANMEIIMISKEGAVFPIVEAVGSIHRSSEFAGVAFDPSGTRLYFSSQRAYGAGATYELRGPFQR